MKKNDNFAFCFLTNSCFIMCALTRFLTAFFFLFTQNAYTQVAIERFLSPSYMKGASISLMVKDILNDSIVYCYYANRELIPASVMKVVTTAAALEILGDQFRYETALLYDGVLNNGILDGNLYIRGSGDPTLGSSEITADRDKIMHEWIKSLKQSGIRMITGAVISDESVFDSHGHSMKILLEDMGSYYSQGSYGINIFDNRFTLFMQTGDADVKPEILKTEPDMPAIIFHNHLSSNTFARDSMYITGYPFSNERYLYGTIPSNRSSYLLRGDIPEPSLFLAQYFTGLLENDSIKVSGTPSCYRVLVQNNGWNNMERKFLFSSFSVPMKEIVRVTNHVSHNLYADVLLKTIGLKRDNEGTHSSFDKGISTVKNHLSQKGLNTSSLWMFDGSGLAVADKLTASFLCDLLDYMYNRSSYSDTFIYSLPRAGIEGTVANLLRNSKLHGNLRIKSGSMSRVRSYAGYYVKDDQVYAIALIVNNFSCTQTQMRIDIERLFLSLF